MPLQQTLGLKMAVAREPASNAESELLKVSVLDLRATNRSTTDTTSKSIATG